MSRNIKLKIIEYLDSKIVREDDFVRFLASLSTNEVRVSRSTHKLAVDAGYQSLSTEFVDGPLLTVLLDTSEEIDAGASIKLNGNDTAFDVSPLFAIEEAITSLTYLNTTAIRNIEMFQIYSVNRNVATATSTSIAPTTSASVDLITSIVADYTVLASDRTILANCTSGSLTISLPDATDNKGRKIIVIRTDGSANRVTIGPYLSQTINGALEYRLTLQNQVVELISDGGNWRILDTHS